MPLDSKETWENMDNEVTAATAGRVYRCAACDATVTHERWGIAVDGGHERTFFNPAGLVFRILCFKEAPGVAAAGAASDAFTWFRGTAWRVGLCRGCGAHLGWRYEGNRAPAVFFGLIKSALKIGPE